MVVSALRNSKTARNAKPIGAGCQIDRNRVQQAFEDLSSKELQVWLRCVSEVILQEFRDLVHGLKASPDLSGVDPEKCRKLLALMPNPALKVFFECINGLIEERVKTPASSKVKAR